MKKLLGFVIVTSFVCSYAMEPEEVKTLSIVNQSPKPLILKIKLKEQKAFRRCLVSKAYKDFFVIKNADELKRIEVGIEGTTGFKKLDLKDKTSYTHSLLVLNIPNAELRVLHTLQKDPQHWQTAWTWNFSNGILYDGFFQLKKPMSVEYPELGYVDARIVDPMRYFPGAYNYARTKYSIPVLCTQRARNMDVPATDLLNVPGNCKKEDVERAYAELCEMWNPERFDNPHKKTFAQRMMDILSYKYASLKDSIS